MSTLLTNVKLGNTGVSNLLKSAKTVADAVTANKDEAARIAFSADHSDSAYQAYANYLSGRISQLNATGAVTDNTKAMTLSSVLRSATNSNISFNITNASVAVMDGTSTPQNKLNIITSYFPQAIASGDINLAQSLQDKAYSLSQQIQYQAQTAADAATSLAKANATSSATSEKGVATQLIDSLNVFNDKYTHAGVKYSQKALDDYVKSITPQLNSLGIHLAPGATLNAFSVSQGVAQAVTKAYGLAYDAVKATDPSSADSIATLAANFLGQDGQGGKIPTIGGNMSATNLDAAVVNPGRFSIKADPDYVGNQGGTATANQNPQTGFKFNYTKDSKGNPIGVQPVFAAQPWVNVPMKIQDVANKLGLQIVGGAKDNTVEVAAGKQSPNWVKQILGSSDATTHLIEDQNGNINFEASSTNGPGVAKYLIQGNISSGKYSVYQWGANGYEQVGALGINHKVDATNIGMDRSGLSTLPNGQVDKLGATFHNLNAGFTNPHTLIANGQIATNNALLEANRLAAQAMLTPPAPLPAIHLSAPTPLPTITPAAPRPSMAMPSYNVAPNTVNPQKPTVNPQTPIGFNLQGGGGISLQ